MNQKFIKFKNLCTWKNVFEEDERTFEYLDKHDAIKPNIAHILKIYWYVQLVLKDYEGVLKDLDEVDVLEL